MNYIARYYYNINNYTSSIIISGLYYVPTETADYKFINEQTTMSIKGLYVWLELDKVLRCNVNNNNIMFHTY